MRIALLTVLFLIIPGGIYAQRIHTILHQSWTGSAWQDSLLETYTYDSRGLKAARCVQLWSASGSAWENSRQEIYSYNPDSTVHQEITQDWDATAHAWQNYSSVSYAFTSQHACAADLYQYWVNGSWVNSHRLLYTNDKKGHFTKSLWQRWDHAATAWVNEMRTDYSWGRNGKMDHSSSQQWDATKQAWSENGGDRVRFSYDASARCLGNSDRSFINKRWRNNVNSIISYDAQGHKTSQTVQVWDGRGGAWINMGHDEYTNNSDGSISYYTALRWTRSGGEPVSRQMIRYTYL